MNNREFLIAAEGDLDVAVARRIIQDTSFLSGKVLGYRGKPYLHRKCKELHRLSRWRPVLMITDLDRDKSPQDVVRSWLDLGDEACIEKEKHNEFLLRVAVRSIEAWLLADHIGFANFLNISPEVIPASPEDLPDAKRTLVHLVRSKCRESRLVYDMVPPSGSIRKVGPLYNERLSAFVSDPSGWSVRRAAARSQSLNRLLDRLILLGRFSRNPGD